MSMIQGIVDYITECPLLEGGLIRVEHLGPNPVEYDIETLPVNPVILSYVDGSSVRQYLFAINSREYYTVEMLQNIKNLEFYEKLADWFEEQNHKENFPDIGYPVQKMELVTSGYLYSVDRRTARYQLEIRIEYFKEANKNG